MNQEVEGVKGNTLELEWKFSGIPENHIINNVMLYFNVTVPDSQTVISSWDVSSHAPVVLATGRSLFDSRISVSYTSGIYKLLLSKLQYSDNGPYLLEAAVGPPGLGGSTVKSSIINVEVKGKHKFLSSYFFFARI